MGASDRTCVRHVHSQTLPRGMVTDGALSSGAVDQVASRGLRTRSLDRNQIQYRAVAIEYSVMIVTKSTA